jgi:hypothetical protein
LRSAFEQKKGERNQKKRFFLFLFFSKFCLFCFAKSEEESGEILASSTCMGPQRAQGSISPQGADLASPQNQEKGAKGEGEAEAGKGGEAEARKGEREAQKQEKGKGGSKKGRS